LRNANGRELQPLGGIANVDTVYGNEDGRYLVYRSDEHGFHNPPGIWGLPQIDVAAVGDSFTIGASVPSDSNFVAVIRRRWTATLNLGYGGNGPLIELAALLEYLPRRRPKVVLWVLCEANDIGEDLTRELGSPMLKQYWQEGRSLQNLEARQSEIDALLRSHVEAILGNTTASGDQSSALSAASLRTLRVTLYSLARQPRDHWDTFSQVLRTARDSVHRWNGALFLVYLPVHYFEGWWRQRHRGSPRERHERVLGIGRLLDVPVIDLEPVFEQGGTLHRFLYPYPAHFTAEGYGEVGRAIVQYLEARETTNAETQKGQRFELN
jgi:hypothetical protein